MAKAIAAVSAPEAPRRRLYLDLHGSDAELIGELEVGKIATVAIKGKIVSVREAEDKEYGKDGSITLENFKVKLISNNDFADLASEDVAGDD